jgi:hypothetical protein
VTVLGGPYREVVWVVQMTRPSWEDGWYDFEVVPTLAAAQDQAEREALRTPDDARWRVVERVVLDTEVADCPSASTSKETL